MSRVQHGSTWFNHLWGHISEDFCAAQVMIMWLIDVDCGCLRKTNGMDIGSLGVEHAKWGIISICPDFTSRNGDAIMLPTKNML